MDINGNDHSSAGHGDSKLTEKEEEEEEKLMKILSEIKVSNLKKRSSDPTVLFEGENKDEEMWEVISEKKNSGMIQIEDNFSFECEAQWVVLSEVIDGTIKVSKNNFYFFCDNNKEGNNKKAKNDKKWNLKDIFRIYQRRYLLRNSAMEVFFRNTRTNYFFNFLDIKNRKNFFKAVMRCKEIPDYNEIKSNFSLNPIQLLNKSKLTEAWKKRKISNFDYLMHLNTIAGRNYNDITQYPVFPWILQGFLLLIFVYLIFNFYFKKKKTKIIKVKK